MLETELTQLATSIQRALAKYRAENPLVTIHQVRVRRPDFSLKYRGDIALVSFEPRRIEEDIWDWRDQERFQESVVKTLPEYQSLVSELGPKANLVQDFARSASFASFHGTDTKELSEQVTALGRELEDQPLPVQVRAFISGLSIEKSPLVISDGFILRQPTEEDVAQYIRLDEYGGFSHPLGDAWFSVIGEFVFDVISTGVAQREFLRVIDALRLFRVGGIVADRYEMRSRHSFLHGGVTTLSAPGRFSKFNFGLLTSDAVALSKFLDDVVPLLPDPLNLNNSANEREIAYMRYSDGLFQGGPPERAITSAMTSLEALFLEGESELTHRLAQRVSLFLRILGTQNDARDTYDKVKKGYKIRSTFIHGSSLKSKDRPDADVLAPILLEYARECALVFFQMTTSKGELLRQLDRAMIDPSGVNELEASFNLVAHK
jgi:hypothetical protein